MDVSINNCEFVNLVRVTGIYKSFKRSHDLSKGHDSCFGPDKYLGPSQGTPMDLMNISCLMKCMEEK